MADSGDLRIYESKAWPGTTKESRIQAMITQAVIDGRTFVMVAAQDLPYNASLVTFNSSVRMTREGGNAALVDVRAYGAAGDGVTDDTVPLQQATAFAKSTETGSNVTGTGETVYLPKGIYLVTATIDTYRNMVVRGSGWGSVIRSTTANPIIRMKADAVDNEVRGITWSNFVVDGVATTNNLTGGYSTHFGEGGTPTTRAGLIEMCRFVNCLVGLRLVATQGFAVRDCKFDYNGTGCYISDNAQIGTFDCCDFRSNATVGMLIESTNAIIGGVLDQPYTWTFKDCHYEKNTLKGCIIDGCGYNCFINSKWEQNGDDSLTLQQVNGGFTCNGNLFIGGTWNGNPSASTKFQVNMSNAKGNIFLGCTFNSANTGGINIASTAWRSRFDGCNLASTITDAAAANVGTEYNSPLSSRVASENTIVTLTDAATVAIDSSTGEHFVLTATAGVGATRAIGAPTLTRSGQRISITFIQDGTGGRALTWNAVFKTAWSDTGNTLSKRSTISYIFDGTNWNQDGAQSPYI